MTDEYNNEFETQDSCCTSDDTDFIADDEIILDDTHSTNGTNDTFSTEEMYREWEREDAAGYSDLDTAINKGVNIGDRLGKSIGVGINFSRKISKDLGKNLAKGISLGIGIGKGIGGGIINEVKKYRDQIDLAENEIPSAEFTEEDTAPEIDEDK